MSKTKDLPRFLALFLSLALGLPSTAGVYAELGRSTLRPGSAVDEPKSSVRVGLEEILRGSSAGLEEAKIVEENVNRIFSNEFEEIHGKETFGAHGETGLQRVLSWVDMEGRIVAFGNSRKLSPDLQDRSKLIAGPLKIYAFIIRVKVDFKVEGPDFEYLEYMDEEELPKKIKGVIQRTVQEANRHSETATPPHPYYIFTKKPDSSRNLTRPPAGAAPSSKSISVPGQPKGFSQNPNASRSEENVYVGRVRAVSNVVLDWIRDKKIQQIQYNAPSDQSVVYLVEGIEDVVNQWITVVKLLGGKEAQARFKLDGSTLVVTPLAAGMEEEGGGLTVDRALERIIELTRGYAGGLKRIKFSDNHGRVSIKDLPKSSNPDQQADWSALFRGKVYQLSTLSPDFSSQKRMSGRVDVRVELVGEEKIIVVSPSAGLEEAKGVQTPEEIEKELDQIAAALRVGLSNLDPLEPETEALLEMVDLQGNPQQKTELPRALLHHLKQMGRDGSIAQLVESLKEKGGNDASSFVQGYYQGILEDLALAVARKALVDFVANPDIKDTIRQLMKSGAAGDMTRYFDRLSTLAKEAGYRGIAQLVPFARLREAAIEGQVAVYVQDAPWANTVRENLGRLESIALVSSIEKANLVIGDENTRVGPRQALIQVDQKTAQYVTVGLLNHLQKQGLLKGGSIITLYKGDFGEALMIFA